MRRHVEISEQIKQKKKFMVEDLRQLESFSFCGWIVVQMGYFQKEQMIET